MSLIKRNATVGLGLAIGLACSGNALAGLVNFTITGNVIQGAESLIPNDFGLSAGDSITATGVFDDSALAGGSGTISFDGINSNSLSLSVGTESFTEANDSDLLASITLNAGLLEDLDFFAVSGVNGASTTFSSFFLTFEDQSAMFGQWDTNVNLQPVPVPAAIWLFGSGLLGLVGVARRKK